MRLDLATPLHNYRPHSLTSVNYSELGMPSTLYNTTPTLSVESGCPMSARDTFTLTSSARKNRKSSQTPTRKQFCVDSDGGSLRRVVMS